MELWWVFYPLKGIDVTGPVNDLLNDPLFGDATIISKNHIKDIVLSLKLNEQKTPEHDHEKSLIFLMEHAGIDGEFHSFMAVCRSSPPRRLIKGKGDFVSSMGLDKKARLRASQLVSALALSILAKSKTWQTCGMVEQLREGTRPLAMMCLKDGSFSLQGGSFGNARTIRSRDSIIYLSRKTLSLLSDSYTGTLMTSLVDQNRQLGKSLHRAITESAICLSNALHSVDPANQNLGAVTAIEILIANQGDSFESIKGRILSLIGETNFNYYKGNDVLRARHLYVHKALEPSGSAIANTSLALALVCLCEYSHLAQRFKAKSEVISYLDFLIAARSTRGIWNDEEKTAFALLHRDPAREYKFPYFDREE
ncbi:MAG: hypothetical protein MPW14_18140 [Candidatus Manganitrophus sp.]|nr:hypothetical protein [Candidatus Manganitrophus sp.]WDT79054.1 MAG: hypothetical protein MPW14_18140 [Candidatus Manganitrophus sp.]